MMNLKFDGLRIYAQRGVRPRALVRPRLRGRGSSDGAALDVKPPVADPHAVERGSMEDQILWILGAPPIGVETAEQALRRKETELADAFASLDVARSLSLHRRLVEAHPADPVSAAFVRLAPDARARLLSYLADAPGRAATARLQRG